MRLNWGPITRIAIEAAEGLGHTLSSFKSHRPSRLFAGSGSVRTATCETCYGCCWIAWTGTRGFGAGGRLLKYRCGTPEAAGFKSTEPAEKTQLRMVK